MAIVPGSLDYLYYNGILDHIPYEAYEMIQAAPQGRSQNNFNTGSPYAGNMRPSALGNSGHGMNSNYLNTAMKGHMYGNYGNSYDYYSGSANSMQYGGMLPTAGMYGGGYGGSYTGGINSYPGIETSHNVNGVYNRYDRQIKRKGGFKDSINDQASGSKTGVLNSNSTLKGLAALGILIAIPILIIRGFVKPKVPKAVKGGDIPAAKTGRRARKNNAARTGSSSGTNNKSSFWSKLNPANWFKKK